MNILVTGSSGYIAANLIPVFSLGGHNVVSYDITEGRDILDLGTLATYMEYCDAVIHLAAIVGIVPCRDNLIETINVNIRGTLNVVTLAQQNNIPLIFASTFAAINPQSTYGQTKRLMEQAVLNAGKTVLRMANIYGGTRCLEKHSAVASFERKRRSGEPVEIHGDGSQKRDFVHVSDVATAFLAALEAPPDLYTVSTGIETSILELAQGMGATYSLTPRREKTTPQDKWLKGWTPKILLEEGLKQVACESS